MYFSPPQTSYTITLKFWIRGDEREKLFAKQIQRIASVSLIVAKTPLTHTAF